ncbi:hypothetical protein DFJ77DRAFT_454630 [Powellomyces hirtus]|nr:hypothetical protein DFJ77DRAFT_454630 [Powellomyces hirtus]
MREKDPLSTLSKLKQYLPGHHTAKTAKPAAAPNQKDAVKQAYHDPAQQTTISIAHLNKDLPPLPTASRLYKYGLPEPLTLPRITRSEVTDHDLTEEHIPAALSMMYESRHYSTTYRDIEFGEEEYMAVFGRRVRSCKSHLSICLTVTDPATGKQIPAFVTAVSDLRETLDAWKAAQVEASASTSRRNSRTSLNGQSRAPSQTTPPPSIAIRTFLECGRRTMSILYDKFHDIPVGTLIYVGGTAASKSVAGTNISLYAMQLVTDKARRAGYAGSTGWSSHPAMLKVAKRFGAAEIGHVDGKDIEIAGRKLYEERGIEEVGTIFAGPLPNFV